MWTRLSFLAFLFCVCWLISVGCGGDGAVSYVSQWEVTGLSITDETNQVIGMLGDGGHNGMGVYPNPTNSSFILHYSLATYETVKLWVVPGTDAQGRVMSLTGRPTLRPGERVYSYESNHNAGDYTVTLASVFADSSYWPDGYYRVFFEAGPLMGSCTVLVIRNVDNLQAWYALID